MKIVQVVSRVGTEASGPSYSVCSLARALAAGGHDVDLLSVQDGRPPLEANYVHRLYPRARLLPSLCRSPELLLALRSAAPTSDILHSHNLWLMPNIYPGWVSRGTSTKLVISPRGTLSTWALGVSRWKKRIVWALAQEKVLRAADCLHATAEAEYQDIRSRGFNQPICVIPNGIDIPPAEGPEESAGERRPTQRTLLYVGRLHPGKGVDRLLKAWTTLAPQRPDWCLRIVGPDNRGHEAELRALAASLRAPRVTFVGTAFGAKKWSEYRSSELYVLPTESENFGLTVAEALACGTPVVTTKGAPWSGLERENCGWWIEHGVEALLDALRTATELPSAELEALGARGRAWMLRDFSWNNVAEEMASVYRWLRSGGTPPSTVRLD